MPERERERKPTELEKRLSQDERLHTHCLHAELLPTPSRDSAYCSRGLCYADTLQLASLPTPINTATHLHPFFSFTPFLSLLSLSVELWYYSSSQGTERQHKRHDLNNVEKDKLPWKPEAQQPCFPRRLCSTMGFQAWNMLSHTQGVKNDTDHDAR